MKILKAIGSIFVKIWRWIKNTAWVQPLLIVGAIFGVIFSIPAITSGIQGLINNANSADTFYNNFKKSMEGGKNSAIDTLIERYNDYKSQYDAYHKDHPEDYTWVPEVAKEEQKYFLMFTTSGNAAAKDIKAGFEVLRDNWGGDGIYKPKDETDFKLYTVYTDEETTETTKNETAFSQFINRKNWFFEWASEVGFNSNYYLNKKITEEDLRNLEQPDPDNFKAPLIILVDWKYDNRIYKEDEKIKGKEPGITQLTYDVAGSDSYTRAKTLYDCWNNLGDFSSNPS